MQIPAICRIVIYTLTQLDADKINKRIADATRALRDHQAVSDGSVIHVGVPVSGGDQYPMMIVKVWEKEPTEMTAVDGQVFLAGNHAYWVRSVSCGEGPGSWRWPGR
jgi:hypothetical protein